MQEISECIREKLEMSLKRTISDGIRLERGLWLQFEMIWKRIGFCQTSIFDGDRRDNRVWYKALGWNSNAIWDLNGLRSLSLKIMKFKLENKFGWNWDK